MEIIETIQDAYVLIGGLLIAGIAVALFGFICLRPIPGVSRWPAELLW
jgi:hypothetical protein